MKLSKQEMILGGLSVAVLGFKISWIVLLLSPICAILWALGGDKDGSKLFRRLGVPLSAVAFSTLAWGLHWHYFLTIPLGFAALTCGDGYPDPSTGDAGSWLGSKIYSMNLFTDELGGLLTKVLVVVILQPAWIPIILF
jgi:hypothetical protein